MTDLTVAKLTAVYEAVHKNVMSNDDPANFNKTLEELFDNYIMYGFDGTDTEYRAEILYHYKNMHSFMEAIGEIL